MGRKGWVKMAYVVGTVLGTGGSDRVRSRWPASFGRFWDRVLGPEQVAERNAVLIKVTGRV